MGCREAGAAETQASTDRRMSDTSGADGKGPAVGVGTGDAGKNEVESARRVSAGYRPAINDDRAADGLVPFRNWELVVSTSEVPTFNVVPPLMSNVAMAW